MPLFVVIAVVIGVLVLAAVFAPVLRARPAVGGALVALTLATTAGLYAMVGTPAALDPEARTAPATLADAVSRLEVELRRDPRQPEGWQLLANAYRTQGRLADAARAFARAVELAPDNADLLAEAAEARALASKDRRFDPEAVALLERALQRAPEHERARWFLGVALRQAGRPADAARTWEPMLGRVQPGTAAALRQQIDEARAEAGLPALPAATPDARTVTVFVTLDATLRARAQPDANVFVIARRVGGPPMPVAVRRFPVSQLPAEVRLSDADSLMPTGKLSTIDRVEIVARVAQAGTADPRAGDFESGPIQVDVGGRARLGIDRVRQ